MFGNNGVKDTSADLKLFENWHILFWEVWTQKTTILRMIAFLGELTRVAWKSAALHHQVLMNDLLVVVEQKIWNWLSLINAVLSVKTKLFTKSSIGKDNFPNCNAFALGCTADWKCLYFNGLYFDPRLRFTETGHNQREGSNEFLVNNRASLKNWFAKNNHEKQKQVGKLLTMSVIFILKWKFEKFHSSFFIIFSHF